MPDTNVPPLVFGDAGFVAPAESAILAGRIFDFNAAFGGNLNPALNTPQGQLASSDTAIIADSYDQQALLFNSVDPAYASGRMQDAIGRIYFLTRLPALPTVVQVTCTGLVNTVIPNGALAQDTSGNLYFCTAGGTIPAGGSIVLPFSNLSAGPIPCPASTLTAIYQAIPGWDSVTNASDGVLGQDVETRAEFEARREATVAANSVGTIGAIIGEIAATVSGVLDYFGYSNNTAAPVTVQGVTIAANAIYVAVTGGTEIAVAQAILAKIAPGTPMTGNTTVTAYDSNPLYSAPIAYSIIFEIPPPLTIYFNVVLANGPLVPSNAVTLVQAAIINAFAGEDGGPRARIGTTIFALRFVNPILAALPPGVEIRSIGIGSINAPNATFSGSISGTTLTVASTSGGAVAIGQFLDDTTGNILEGTIITAGSGSSWTVNMSQTVTSETMYGVAASASSVVVNANQEPVTDALDMQVSAS